jgi:hypothetical protein
MSFAEEKARDALAFEPLPSSRWVRVHEKNGILIRVRYSESLSRLLRSLPQARWEAEHKQWRYPFSSSDAIRRAIPDIERLAAVAQEAADKETERREAQRARAEKAREDYRRERERRRAMAQPRPLQGAFLDIIPGRPRFALRLEAIADNLRALGPIAGFKSRCWVARIFGSDGRGGWVRVFVDGARDYADANSVGSRGIYINYFLEEGPIYEVSSPQTWRSTERYFVRIIDGRPRSLTKEEVEQCLAR